MKLLYGKLLLQYDQLNKSQIKFLFVYNKSQYNLVLKRLVTMISKKTVYI